MNKYIIPICNIPESKVYLITIFANSYEDCRDRIMEKFSDYSDSINYKDFANDLDKQDILIGKISDIEEL